MSTIHVEVEVEADYLLSKVSDSALLDEIVYRELVPSFITEDDLHEIYQVFIDNNLDSKYKQLAEKLRLVRYR